MRFSKIVMIAAALFLSSNVVAQERVHFSAASEYALSSAEYHGTAEQDGATWSGELGVQLLTERAVEIPIFPRSGVLAAVTVDGKSAALFTREEYFSVLVQGRGAHAIQLRFNTPVEEQGGLSTVRINTVQTPVSRFQLSIPGDKEVKVTPNAVIERRRQNGRTAIAVHMPMSSEVGFSWSNVLPDGTSAEAKLHATAYHFVLPEEGVLSMRGLISYELLKGEVTTAAIEIPNGFEVTKVAAPGLTISDWRVAHEGASTLYVTFQEPVKTDFTIDCTVERPLSKVGDPNGTMPIEPLKSRGVSRQHGIVALLSGKDVALSPTFEKSVLRVGENQIPASIRGLVSQNVLHTFKYHENDAQLTVASVAPEKKAGRFDAVIHTLYSLGDVSIKGSAKAHLQIKAGAVQEIALSLPKGSTVLSVTAPSMRTHSVESRGDTQRILVQFTQEMEGAFPIELQFERILGAEEAEPALPTIHLEGAEVEQGKFAVEALTAVEVQPGTIKEFSPLELTEVPQEIRLQTSNPLLLAFKYPRFDATASATLKVTRHQEIETQPAVVDQVQYDTLVVAEGTSVTSARFTVRNTKSQFLRLMLPHGSTIWSATVQGQAAKPARAEREGRSETLIKIINSRAPFQVEVVYATPRKAISLLGLTSVELPTADLTVTRTVWNLFMPDGFLYGPPHTGLSVGYVGETGHQEDFRKFSAAVQSADAPSFGIAIPTSGIRYTFTKVLSNETAEGDSVTFGYLTGSYGLPRWILMLSCIALAVVALSRAGRISALPPTRERLIGIPALATTSMLVLYFGIGFGTLLLAAITTSAYLVYPAARKRFDNRSSAAPVA